METCREILIFRIPS